MSTQTRRSSRISASAIAAFVLAGALAFAGAGAARADDAPANPLTAAPIQATTKQGQAVSIQLLGSGPVGDQLGYSVMSETPSPKHGTIMFEFNGSPFASGVTYTPPAGFSGVDTFTYTVSDNQLPGVYATANVTVTVTPVAADNHAPTAIPITASVENPPFDGFPATGTDPDGDHLTFGVASPPSHGTASTGLGLNGVTYFYYSPDAGYLGPDSFTFTANDGVLTSAPATATITVVPERSNSAPTSVPPVVTTAQDTPVAINLTGTDADGDQIYFDTYGDASHGTVTGDQAGHLVYTPTLGYSGPDSFHYEVSDHRSTSATYTINITVTPAIVADHTPTVVPFSVLSQGRPIAIHLLGTDPDGDALTFATAGGPHHGVLSGSGADLIYTPTNLYLGTDSFTYTASDGTHVSTPAAVAITVQYSNAPIDPSLDVSVSADQKQAASKVVSPVLSTTGADRLVLAFVSVDGPPSSTASGAQSVSSVTGGGLSWSLVKRSNSTWGTAEVWQAHATAVLSKVAVTAKFSKGGYDGSITVAAFANTAGAVGDSVAAAGKSGAPSASLTIGDAPSLIWAAGHDWTRASTPVPVGAQQLVHAFADKRTGDSFWTQQAGFEYVAAPVTIAVSAPVRDRWQLVAVTIPGTAGHLVPFSTS